MKRRNFFSLLTGLLVLFSIKTKAQTNIFNPEAERLGREWARYRTIFRPSTGDVFISLSRGIFGGDYIHIGNVNDPARANIRARYGVVTHDEAGKPTHSITCGGKNGRRD